jgi:hypothetical protein
MLRCGRFYGRHACDIWVLCLEGGGRLLVLGIFSDMLKRRGYTYIGFLFGPFLNKGLPRGRFLHSSWTGVVFYVRFKD